MRITFESNTVDVKSGTSKKTGRPYSMRSQNGIAEIGKFRQPCRINLADEQAAYPPGVYEMDNSADALLKLNGYGDFETVRHLPLRPVADAQGKRAA